MRFRTAAMLSRRRQIGHVLNAAGPRLDTLPGAVGVRSRPLPLSRRTAPLLARCHREDVDGQSLRRRTDRVLHAGERRGGLVGVGQDLRDREQLRRERGHDLGAVDHPGPAAPARTIAALRAWPGVLGPRVGLLGLGWASHLLPHRVYRGVDDGRGDEPRALDEAVAHVALELGRRHEAADHRGAGDRRAARRPR